MKSPAGSFTGLTPLYSSVFNAWRTLSFTRSPAPRPGMWLFEEPLFDNHFLSDTTFSSFTLGSGFVEAGMVKLTNNLIVFLDV